MKRLWILGSVILAMTTLFGNAYARDDRNMYSLSEALNTEAAKSKLDGSVRFYFGDQSHPGVSQRFGEVMTNKKTNAFNKTDKHACEWAFLSAMLSFQNRAKREGGNAVINIRSYYKKNEISSTTEFECGAGRVIAGVTFKGEIVKIGN